MKTVLKIAFLLLSSLVLIPAASAARQGETTLRGTIIDESGVPAGFATAFLSRADGAVVCGVTAGEDGRFELKASAGTYTLTVSLVGYRDASQIVSLKGSLLELPPIRLEEDAELLGEAVVSAVMPKTQLTGEGLQTNVRGSVLENVGSANDVLAKTPGLIKGQNGLEVIGKGTPLVYINGRRLTDASELDRLQSNEIQSVEVITNPGAQYDATVRSVVRIRTVKRQGDGFGFNLYASDSQSPRWKEHNDPTANLNVNYRTGGVDLFAGVNYTHFMFRQESDLHKSSFGKNLVFEDKGTLSATSRQQIASGNAGVNWQISDFHFVGGKVEWGRTLDMSGHTVVADNVFENGAQVDNLTTTSDDRIGDRTPGRLGANLYYNGLVGGKLGIDVNLDYYGSDASSITDSKESSSMTHDASISSNSFNDSRLYAAKAVLSYPVGNGQFQLGTEETFSRRNDVYSISGIEIPASTALIKEDNYAGFASYAFVAPKVGQFSAGVRYEYVRYSYEDALAPKNNLQRDYGNWFPTVSYAGALGPVQLMFNYSAKTQRPNYDNLSNAIRYNSRYIWQSGNARLQPEISNNVSLTAVWNFITFMVNYTRTDNAIMTWSSPYGEEGVVLVQPRNIETPFRTMSAFVNLTPTIGPWTMNYTLGIQPQWLTINAPDPREASGIRVTKFNGKPIFFAQLLNTLRFDGGWQFELGGLVQSKGYSGNLRMNNVYCDLTAAVQKTLLKDGSLVLRLDGADLLGLARMNVDSDFGSHTISQTNLMDNQRIKLSVRYSFNTAPSKYKGTGAGNDTRDRMKQ
ncbi:MAG: outer membrane beta-barrel protein [Bacteroidales bacterium]|nr:outer membrane beta-barrel protein [Bacteroidales bacterium]